MKTWVLGFLVASFYSSSALAAVMVLPVEGTNLEQGEKDAIWQMVAVSYQGERGETVAPAADTSAAIEQTGNYGDAARKVGASEYVYVSAVRLEQRIVISASLYGVDGKLIHSAKITASSLDDIEPAADRLAKALVKRTTTKETRQLDTVTKTESKRPNRTWVEKVVGVKAGITMPLGYGEEIAPMMSVGFNGRYEGASHFLEFGVGMTIPANSSEYDMSYGGLYAELGANLYLSNTSVSPYLGGGVLPRLAGKEYTNLAAFGQGGLMFFRESSSRLYVDLRVAQNVLPIVFHENVTTESGTVVQEDEKLYPTEFTVSLGVGF
ncbi:MAG TPA: hypothetical protein VIM73_01045 [Polyangiaceae bacterium]